MDAFDHVDLTVSSLDASLPIYRSLLGPLGFDVSREIEGERAERVVYLSRDGSKGALGLRERQAGDGDYDRYDLGLHHLAFGAEGRAEVDRIAALAAELGLETEGQPGEYDYALGYYAVFVHDPDGIKLEFMHRPVPTEAR